MTWSTNLGALPALALLLAVSCSTGRVESTAPRAARAFEALEHALVHDARIATRIAPREEAFARGLSTDDQESRGRIVSEGWRSTKEKRFTDLGVRLPEAANGAFEVGLSRFEARRLQVTLEAASGAEAVLDRGRVAYVNALPSVDRVMVSNASSLEELLVIHDDRAPRSFVWNIRPAAEISRVTRSAEGALSFEDARGASVLAMRSPRAFDAHGASVALTSEWHDDSRTLTLTLPSSSLAYPVVVDPEYETSAWFAVAQRDPTTRSWPAMAYDVVRGEMVLFGGIAGTTLDETWVWNGTVWKRRFPAVSPPARRGHVLAFDRARGEIVLFGGEGDLGRLTDTWTWNGVTWTLRTPATAPPGRTFAVAEFDRVRNEVVMFGGVDNATYFGDTWVWNGTTWARRATTGPLPRTGHAMAFDVARGELVLFGGSVSSFPSSETWFWNGSAWSQRGIATSPPSRFYHTLTYDSVRNEMVLFGGLTLGPLPNDTWIWNGTTWAQRPTAASPGDTASGAAAFDEARAEVILYGGGSVEAATWAWNGVTWTRRSANLSPPERYTHTMAYDSIREEVVLFGGIGPGAVRYADTWIWNGLVWQLRTPAVSPPGRAAAALAFDAARSEIVMYGGGANAVLDDTWVWNGTTWARRLPAQSPPPLAGHGLAYDAVRREVVLFGGGNNSRFEYDETWVWNGTTWARRTPAIAPSPRAVPGLAFDGRRGEIVLFGGLNGSDALGDTWTWNGATWTRRTPPLAPPARFGTRLAFDTVSGDVVLFGGEGSAATFYADTWGWNGAAWTRRSATLAPSPRTRHGMAFDAARKQMVLHGGYGPGPTPFYADTWLHTTLGGGCATNADCIDAAFCVDGVCCSSASCGTCRTCAGTSPGRCAPITNDEDPDSCAMSDNKSCGKLGDCKAALGVAATSADECASGHVVDGVCCSVAKCGECETCDVAKKARVEFPGQCSAAKEGTDPHDDCADDGVATCKHTGQCDGNRACALYPARVACGSARVCTGGGECVAESAMCVDDHTSKAAGEEPVDCGSFRCIDGVCAIRCVNSDQCRGGAACTEDGFCKALAPASLETSRCSVPRVGAEGGGGSFTLAIAIAAALARVSRRRRPRA